MRVTLAAAHRQPRRTRPESCDNCVGHDLGGHPVPVSLDCDSSVRLYNVLMGGGIGTDSFHLHAECAAYIAGDSDSPMSPVRATQEV